MTSTVKDRIDEIKKNGYQLNFENVLNHAFENYKKIALYAGLVLFVFSILFGIVASIIIASLFDVNTFDENFIESLNPENLSGYNLLIYFVSSLLFTCLLHPFTSGFLKMADCGEKDEAFHVSTIFSYYKSPYFKEIFLSTFLITLLGSGTARVLQQFNFEITGVLFLYTVSFFTYMTIPLIVFGNLKAIDAIKASIIIVSKQPLLLLGLIIVAIIGTLVGFIGCCIGVFFTIPFLYSMNYAIYHSIIGIDYEDESEEV